MSSPADIALRPMVVPDLPALARWLVEPHVSGWWIGEPQTLDTVSAKYRPCIDGDDPTDLFVIELGGEAIGFMQRYLLADDPDWSLSLAVALGQDVLSAAPAAGIDYLIGDVAAVGLGLGTTAIGLLVDLAYQDLDIGQILVDVSQANRASWRALERNGFERLWSGRIDAAEPSAQGDSYIYRHRA